jgi:hypothetical protein
LRSVDDVDGAAYLSHLSGLRRASALWNKKEVNRWKVYYECNDGCGFDQMAGRVKLTDVEHQDEVHDRAREMGEQWTNRNEQK